MSINDNDNGNYNHDSDGPDKPDDAEASDLVSYFVPAPIEHQKREKAKAQELRKSQWWRQQIGPGICYYCEQKFPSNELTMDHKMPIVRGGKSTKSNVVPSCKE